MPVAVALQPLSTSGLPSHSPAPPPNRPNLPDSNHNAFTRCVRARCRRTLEHVWACLEIAWATLQDIWDTTRRKFTLSTWLAISISVIVGGLGLRYAFVQIVLSYEALRLAEWTARKDFWELCQEQKVSNNAISAKCELVLRTDFPSPPDVNLGRRTRSRVPYGGPIGCEPARDDTAYLTQGVLLSALAAGLLLGNYRRIRRLLNALLRGSAMGNNRARNRSRVSYHGEEASNTIAISQMSTGSERPPAKTLRRRGLKKHSNYPNIWKAAEAGNVEDVVYHLEAGAEVNARNPSYGNPLSTAARHGRSDVVNFLLGRGADVQSRTDIFAEAALHAAAEGGYEAIVATLLNNGADVDAKVGGISPIYAAASRRHRSVVHFLLERGAKTGILMDFLPEPLQMFSMSGYMEVRCRNISS